MISILLHKQDIPAEISQELVGHGIIAIQTDDLESFKLLSLDPMPIPTTDFLHAALDALRAAGVETSKGSQRLVTNLAALADAEQKKTGK